MIKLITRQVAILALLNGLLDAGRLLGVGAGPADPLAMFSFAGFAYLGAFAIARIFAAVGMWIESNWGVPLLLGTTLVELVLFLFGIVALDIGFFGLIARLVQLAGTLLLLWVAFSAWRSRIHE